MFAGASSYELAHSCALGNLNSHGAGHAVTAASAEISAQILSVRFNQFSYFIRHLRRIRYAGKPLVKFLLTLDSPDGKDVVKLCLKCIAGPVVGQKTAGKALHCNKAHVVFPALVHKLKFLLSADITERKLKCLIQAAVYGLMCNVKAVVGNSYVTDQTLCLCLKCRLIQSCSVSGHRTERRVVELVNIHIVPFQVFQCGLQVLPKILCLLCGGL